MKDLLSSHRLFAQALQRLEVLKSQDATQSFEPPATVADIQAVTKSMACPIPQEWEQVLMVSNGWEYPNPRYYTLIVDAFSLSMFQTDVVQPYLEQKYPGFAQRFLAIGDSECSDLYCLDVGNGSAQCRAVLFSHETGNQIAEWPSVAEFLLSECAE